MRNANFHFRILAGLFLAQLIHFGPELCAQPPKNSANKPDEANAPAEKSRRYADGPLTPDDFKLAAPDPVPTDAGISMVAMTYAELRYSYHYRFEEKNGRATAWPVDVEVFAVMVRAKSWNTQPQSVRILDHEQGHFDLAEIHARRASEKLNKALADRKYIGRGKTEAEARTDLESQLNKAFEALVDQLMAEQKEYDRATQHGLADAAQAEARKVQKEQLEETLNPKRKPQNDKKTGP